MSSARAVDANPKTTATTPMASAHGDDTFVAIALISSPVERRFSFPSIGNLGNFQFQLLGEFSFPIMYLPSLYCSENPKRGRRADKYPRPTNRLLMQRTAYFGAEPGAGEKSSI